MEQPIKFINTEYKDIIELKSIKQIYDNKPPIISDFNLLIEDKPGQGQFIVLLGSSGCVDQDTEFFNGYKWIPISKYSKDDCVLQYTKSGNAELVKPFKYIKIKSDCLFSFKTKYGVDQSICPEHNVIYIDKRRPNNILSISGQKLFDKHLNSKKGFHGSFITTFNYVSGKGIKLNENQIRLSVAAIADGHYSGNTNYCTFNLKKHRKINRLINLIKKCNISYTVKIKKDGFTAIKCETPRHDRIFTSYWYDCSQAQLKIICDEIMYWDGSISNNIKYISTSKKETADFIQFAYSGCGIRSTISIIDRRGQLYNNNKYNRKSVDYKVLIASNNFVSMKSSLGEKIRINTIKPQDGYKYCFTVPSGMLVLRKNNKIFITGNCGKSTILKYIAGLQKPTEGDVLINGKLRSDDDRIGMVFQRYSSYEWLSVLDNVALGLEYKGVPRKERKERAMEMVRKVGLEGHEQKYAKHGVLSGGQLQRVAIARSLAYESKILLMDEPFGALDIETRLQMQDLLANIWTEIHPTIIFVTHDIPEAVYLGDDIYVMGKNPGNIRNKFKSPLPYERNKLMKRDLTFINKVNEIEDYMINVGAK